jgi:hypothetical protein
MQVLLVIFALIFGPSAFSQEAPKTPEIESQQQSEGGLKATQNNHAQQQGTPQTPAVVPQVHSERSNDKGNQKSGEGAEEGTEFWPPFWGMRLKITDTLLAAFTFLLFLATVALYWATRRLVKGADKTAEAQLRAYISITPKDVLNWRHQTNFLGVRFEIENHGQTPGLEICYTFGMEIFDAVLPQNHVFPEPNRQFDQNNSLFPKANVPVWLWYGRVLTSTEVTSIETNKRFYTWGVMTYVDTFGQIRTTRFSFSFGGPDFGQAMRRVPNVTWSWQNGQHHNDTT